MKPPSVTRKQDKMPKKLLILLIGTIYYIVPLLIFYYVYGSIDATTIWMALGWVFSVVVMAYLS